MADRASSISPYASTPKQQSKAVHKTPTPTGTPTISRGTRTAQQEFSVDLDSPPVSPIGSPEASPFQVFVSGPGTDSSPLLRAGTGLGRCDSLLSQTSCENSFSEFSSFSSFGSYATGEGSPSNMSRSASSVATAPSSPEGLSQSGSLMRLNSYQRESRGEGQEAPTVVIMNWNLLLVTVRANPALKTDEVEAALKAVRWALDQQEPNVGQLDLLFNQLHELIANRIAVQADFHLLHALSQLKGSIATMPDELPWMYRNSLRS